MLIKLRKIILGYKFKRKKKKRPHVELHSLGRGRLGPIELINPEKKIPNRKNTIEKENLHVWFTKQATIE